MFCVKLPSFLYISKQIIMQNARFFLLLIEKMGAVHKILIDIMNKKS